MVPSEGYVTTDDGVRLFFQKFGNGLQTAIIPNGFYFLDDFRRLAGGRTLIVYDVRNRGRSDAVTDASKIARGIQHDVDDLEAVRRHFDVTGVDLIGHSYIGLMVALHAMKYPAHIGRVVQVGPVPPHAATKYPAHLTNADATLAGAFARIGQLQAERGTEDPIEFCRKVWSVLRVIYVADPADAGKIDWGRCELPNERNFMSYFTRSIMPSIQSLALTAGDMAKVTMPVLIVHGTKDRSAPYGGGRDWALQLPNARLVTADNAAHAPWLEAPDKVFPAIQTFLDGAWPESAETVTALDPDNVG